MVTCRSTAKIGANTQRTKPTLLDLFREHGPAFAAHQPLRREQRRFLRAVQACRTAALGGHLYACSHCDYELPLYNSCRNRHCPACQALDQARWIARREERLLPVGHHHVVFTLPSELRALTRRHPRAMLGLLFNAASATLAGLARDRWAARLGATAVLHTWTRQLTYHPHLHCIVTAGGLSLDGERWVHRRRYLYPVRQLKHTFAAHIRRGLQLLREAGRLLLPGEHGQADPAAWQRFVRSLPKWRKWVVYVEPPFGRSTHVLRYLGRYTHRVAISDARVVSIENGEITFRTRGDDQVTLSADEFIRRFVQHVLPTGFHKIRHFGLYAGAAKARHARALALLGDGDRDDSPIVEPEAAPVIDSWVELLALLTGRDPLRCPRCRVGTLGCVSGFAREPRPPP